MAFKLNSRKTLFTVFVVAWLVVAGGLYWRYASLAPSRTASSFIFNLASKGDVNAAYSLTADDYKSKVSPLRFANQYSPLVSSKVTYTVSKQIVTGKYAVVNGVLKDLHGANYNYAFHMVNSSGRWLVDATYAGPQ